jgi:hypothetical protein
MTLGRAEFDRLLPAAVDGACTPAQDGFRGAVGAGHWRIRLMALPPLHRGALSLERLGVALELEGLSAPQAEAFIDRFQLYFQRGGG